VIAGLLILFIEVDYVVHAVNLIDESAGITLVPPAYNRVTKRDVTFTKKSHSLKKHFPLSNQFIFWANQVLLVGEGVHPEGSL